MNSTEKHIHAELFERCILQDQQAQMEIYRLYSRMVFATVNQLVADVMDAEELMQEAFLSAFQQMEKLGAPQAFGSWIKQIAVRKAIDYLRLKSLVWESITGDIPTNDDWEEETNIEQILETMKQLPDGYRVILSLYLLEGYDHEEIAEILQISASTSRSQYTRAKAKLKEKLTEVGYVR